MRDGLVLSILHDKIVEIMYSMYEIVTKSFLGLTGAAARPTGISERQNPCRVGHRTELEKGGERD